MRGSQQMTQPPRHGWGAVRQAKSSRQACRKEAGGGESISLPCRLQLGGVEQGMWLQTWAWRATMLVVQLVWKSVPICVVEPGADEIASWQLGSLI